MNNIGLKYSPFKLELSNNFENSKAKIFERKGFIIKLESDGKTGYGEANPLPEFGSETFEQDEEALKDFKLNLNILPEDFIESIEDSLRALPDLPALRHGFEQAILNLLCAKANISLNEILNCTSRTEIKVNAVIGLLNPAKSASAALRLVKEGFTTLKIKAGREQFKDDLNCLVAIQKAVGDDVKLRIDANGKWNIVEAIDNLKLLESFNVEYVEQPVNNLIGFQKVSKKSSIPLAADESIRSFDDAKNFIQSRTINALVLKPMLLGGIIPTLKIIKIAERENLKVIISSSFESSLGRSWAIFVASTVNEEIAHGLDTARFLKNDLYPNPYPVRNGRIFLQNNN
ncbi:MAG: o-succinylbenzoate synthase [Ignavibacteriaceae bacterium]